MAEIIRYRCSGCGWIYDPRFGDAANEIARGVAFADLPAKFICGVCGCPKEKFVKHDVLGGAPEAKKAETKKTDTKKTTPKKK
jgi:rubredoxin